MRTMHEPIQVDGVEQQERFCALPGLSALSPATVTRHRPDAQWMLAADGDAIVARCSLWWSATPRYPGHRVGLIGHYAAATPAAAAQLLQLACDQLAAQGCTLAVGPMDGSTWERYRLLTERGPEPPFFLEPDNPDDWPAHFTGNGFGELAHYYSAVTRKLVQDDPRLARIAERVAAAGIRIRPLDSARFSEELHRVYGVAVASFRNAFLYSPIAEADFVDQYRRIEPYVRPELVLLAEHEGRPVGFIFAVPDLLQAQRGQAIDTVVIKTLAVHPEYTMKAAGLGNLLTARCHEMVHDLGYTRAIHALEHEHNSSRKISARYDARTIRRYTLFARALESQP
jgi:hypothetical protein